MVEERIGENMGPIDWDHPIAKDMPAHWREAEKEPSAFLYCPSGFSSFQVCALAMYDGWPYWTPRPAIQYVGPLGSTEWTFFDSYGVRPGSIFRDPKATALASEGGE